MDSIKKEPITPNGAVPTVNTNELSTQVHVPTVQSPEEPPAKDDTPSDPQVPVDSPDNPITFTKLPSVPKIQPGNESIPPVISPTNQTATSETPKGNFLHNLAVKLHLSK